MTKRLPTTGALMLAACAMLLWTGTALATPTPQQRCDNARIKAWKAYRSCVDAVVAKDAKEGLFYEAKLFKPFAKCRHAYFKKWTAFQTKASLATSTCIGPRFTDNTDQTVTDNLTGLVWEKKDDLGGIHDKDDVYTWSTGVPYKENGTAFTGFLGSVNSGGGFAGSNGWRLPTVAELQTIVLDFACTGTVGGPTCNCGVYPLPCVDPALDTANTPLSYFWSGTGYISMPLVAWSVAFDDGAVTPGEKTFTPGASVRAVRGGW